MALALCKDLFVLYNIEHIFNTHLTFLAKKLTCNYEITLTFITYNFIIILQKVLLKTYLNKVL